MTEQDEQKADRTDIAEKAKANGYIQIVELAGFLIDDGSCSKVLPDLLDAFFPKDNRGHTIGYRGGDTNVDKWRNLFRRWTRTEPEETRKKIRHNLPKPLKIYSCDINDGYVLIDIGSMSDRNLSFAFLTDYVKLSEFKEYLNYVGRGHHVIVPLWH